MILSNLSDDTEIPKSCMSLIIDVLQNLENAERAMEIRRGVSCSHARCTKCVSSFGACVRLFNNMSGLIVMGDCVYGVSLCRVQSYRRRFITASKPGGTESL